jgi:hypothetical protein
MTERQSVLELGTGRNGAARKPRGKRPVVTSARVSRMRQAITVGMGCGIPCLSLALSSIGGRLIEEGHRYLGGAALVLCCGVLAVSLSHLAWALRDITRSAWWQAWALAVAIDVSLVLGELASVAGFRLWLVPVVMVAVCVVSAVLNCWAFLRHSK